MFFLSKIAKHAALCGFGISVGYVTGFLFDSLVLEPLKETSGYTDGRAAGSGNVKDDRSLGS